MKQPILTAIVGQATILVTTTMPSADDVQLIAQTLIQLIIGIVTIWKILSDRKK